MSGQILIYVGGKGWYQEWGKDPVAMKPGDSINYGEAFCLGEIENRSICIGGDIAAVLELCR